MSYQQGYGQPHDGYGQQQQRHGPQQQGGYGTNAAPPVGPPRQRGNYPPVQPDYSQTTQGGSGYGAPHQPQGGDYAYDAQGPPAYQSQGGYGPSHGDYDAPRMTLGQDAARTAQQNRWGQSQAPVPAQSTHDQQGHDTGTAVQQAGGWGEQRQLPAPGLGPAPASSWRGYEDHMPSQQNQGRYSAQQIPNTQPPVQQGGGWVDQRAIPASAPAPTPTRRNGGHAAQPQPDPPQAGSYHAQPQLYSTEPQARSTQPQPQQALYQQGAYQAAVPKAPAQQSGHSVVSSLHHQPHSLQPSTHGLQSQAPPVAQNVYQAPLQQGGYEPPAQLQGYAPTAQSAPVRFQQQQGYAPTDQHQQSTYGPPQHGSHSFTQQATYTSSTQGYATSAPPPTGYIPSTRADFSAPATPFPPFQGSYAPSTVAPTPISSHTQPHQLPRGPPQHGMMPQQQPIPAAMQGRQEKVRESDFVNPSNDIERRLNELSLKSLNLTSYVARPGFGQQGKPISVLANIFAARFKDGIGKTIHHYDIDIDPVVKVSSQKKPVTLLRAVWEQLTLVAQGPWAAPFQAAAFDGRKNAFTPVKFPIQGPQGTKHQIIIALPEQGSTDADEARRFKVVIKHVADVDLESLADFCRSNSQSQHAEEMMLTAVMSVNVLLRDAPTKRYCSVGASGNRFFGLQGAVDLPGGAIVCRGFMQYVQKSFRYTNSGGPGVQIDTAYSAFSSSGRLLDVAAKILGIGGGFGGGRGGGFGGRRGDSGGGFGGRGGPSTGLRPGDQLQTLQPGDIAMLKSKLKLAKFKVTHRPSSRIFTIMSVTQQAAEDISFILEGRDGQPDRKVNICTYFKEMYGVTVTKPRLPCVAFGKKGYIPMEFVDIEPFHSLPPMRLSSDQTAEMIKVSARPPRERADHIMNWRRELAYEKQLKVAAWGIEISPDMMDVQARVLAPPTIMYANGDARANNGSWSLRGKKFVRECTPLKAWSVVSFDRYCDAPKMGAFIGKLVSCLSSHGIKVETTQPPLLGPFNPNQDGSIRQGLGDAAGAAYKMGGRAPQLVIVLLPGRDQWIYESIKRTAFCDLKAPIPTQCLQTMKLKNERGLDQYCDNVSMKIHVKLGGLTHQVPLTNLPHCDKTTMLVGVDVTHPPPKPGSDTIAPSVAVSVATHNETCDAYNCQIRLQEGREETCQDLASMMEAHVRLFEEKNRVKPCKLIIFRDGVSEGQYAAVVQNEYDAVLRGCRAVHHDYRPKVSFIIAAKRHNMRFFANNPQDVDRSGNLPPGLVVDNGVVHPFAFDFYLQAHAGLVGTSRPTHYLALIDEIKFSPDELHRLVNSLCYSFVRATRSVSLIPVAYTADIICSQVRAMVHDDTPSDMTDSEYSGGHGGFKPRKTRDFDPLRLQKLLAKNPGMAEVAWYM